MRTDEGATDDRIAIEKMNEPEIGQSISNMGEADQALIIEYNRRLRRPVERLSAFQRYGFEDFQSHGAIHRAVEHGLQLAIQCVVDTGGHILASQKLAPAEAGGQTIMALGAHGV